MSGVNLQAIYDRLRSVPAYHPMSANTYADWSMEAGDMVTVSRNGKAYKSPVGSSTVKWTGKQQIQIQSEGSRERDPISRVSARKYATGGGGTSGIRANQSLYYEMIDQDRELRGVISATAESLTVDYTKRISAKGIELEGKIDASAERLTIDYTKKIDDKGVELEGKISASAERLTIDYTDKIGKVESNFDQRAGQIELSVSNLDDRLSAQIAVTDRTASMSVGRVKYSNTLHYANKASFPAVGRSDTLYYADDTGTAYIYIPEAHFYAQADVDEYGNANYIKAGEIVIAINENGDTEAKLDADVIYAGKNTKQTLAGLELPTWMNTTNGLIVEHATILDVHAESIRTVSARCDTLETDYLKTKNLKSAIGNITELNVQDMTVKSIRSERGGISVASVAANTLTLGGTQIPLSLIIGASVSGNTLTLTPLAGNDITFSKAATLSVAYGGNSSGDTATFTVTGTPSENFPSGNTATGTFTVHQSKAAAFIQDAKGTIRARIDNPQYGNGWTAAYGKVSIPTTSSTADNFSIGTPPETVDGAANTETYTMSNPMNDVAVVKNSAGTIVARLEHNQYTAGHDDGFNEVSSPSVTYTDLGATTIGNVSGTASISNKTDGTTRSTSISLSLSKTTYTPSASVGAKDCVVVKTSGGTVVGRIDTSTTNTVTLTCDSIGDIDYDIEGNVYANLNGTTKVTKQITLSRGSIKDDGKLALNAYCDGTRVARKWTSFNYARLTADHIDGNKYYYTSTSNITSGSRIVCW